MIVEEPINTLPEPEFKIIKADEPQSINQSLPPLFFSCLITGSKNSGKSYALTSLLKLYEKNPIYDMNKNKLEQRIILFSPTAKNESNKVFKNLKNLNEDDIYTEYDDEILDEILAEINAEITEANETDEYIKIFKKYQNPKIELTDDEYMILNKNDFEEIEPKQKTITFFIFDDLIGDKSAFNKKRDGGLNRFLLKHRHYYANIIFTTQYINAISPLIKNNIDVFCLFKYANLKEIIDKFYPLVSSILLPQEFEELYKYSSKDKFSFLTIINHNGAKGKIEIRKRWNINLKIK